MIPVRGLPKTVSGKLDRLHVRHWIENMTNETLALLNRSNTSNEDVELPKSPAETLLQRVWAEVLNIDASRIGMQSSFFQLGGDSISAMGVVSRCRAAGASLSVKTLMTSKTIARTAEQIVFIHKAQEQAYEAAVLYPTIHNWIEWSLQERTAVMIAEEPIDRE